MVIRDYRYYVRFSIHSACLYSPTSQLYLGSTSFKSKFSTPYIKTATTQNIFKGFKVLNISGKAVKFAYFCRYTFDLIGTTVKNANNTLFFTVMKQLEKKNTGFFWAVSCTKGNLRFKS